MANGAACEIPYCLWSDSDMTLSFIVQETKALLMERYCDLFRQMTCRRIYGLCLLCQPWNLRVQFVGTLTAFSEA